MTNISPIHLGLLLSLCLMESGCNSEPPLRQKVIEQRALDAIDFEALEPAIREFIELAQANKMIGRPLSDFEELLEHALSRDNLDDGTRLHSYDFTLPITEDLKNANQISTDGGEGGGVVFWPMLVIRVDKKTQEIAYVYVYLQGL